MADVCEVPVISGVCEKAGEAAGTLVAAPFDWLAQSLAHGAGWMYQAVWSTIDSTTMVDATSGELTRVYNILFGVAVFVMLGFFMLQVIGGMIRREPAALSRAALGLGKSILGSFVALTLVAAALEITDQLCVGIVHASGTTMSEMGERVELLAQGLLTLHIAAPGAGAIITIFVAGLAIAAAVIVWISLLVRKALLLVAIVFAPIALAGASWDHTRGWVSRWAAFVLALILSKVVLVVIFLIATTQVSAPIDSDLQSVSDPIAGVVLMLVAGFAPYLTYKAINFMGFDTYHAMSSEQEAKSALNRPLPIPLNRRAGAEPSKVLNGAFGNSNGAGDGSTGAPRPVPTPPVSPTSGAGARTATGAAGAGGATAAAGAATGGLAAGAALATGAASAGVRTTQSIGGAAAAQADAAQSSAPPRSGPVPSHVPDAVPPVSVADRRR
ncbi:type IV secretion system protein [Nocardioides daphniae]|uniref:Conjugal transfer protein TrbL n=1 Tax=Nocardioides daphniae TaxID=402297 RepID=A0ABQ1QFD3_9ACTN|nr:type IV secretion system protein [Nocardioides daphniae]GGD24386.1 hypothetical protein GCM10007231_24430 [Nocardioides daphniae]